MIDDQLLDRNLGLFERLVGGLFVADRPFENMVGMFAMTVRGLHLVLDVLAQDRRIRGKRLERIDDAGQRLVIDLDQLRRVGGDIAVLGDDEGDFLVLEQNLVLGQHRLDVARQRRHVMQTERFQVGGGQDGEDAGQRLGAAGVDAADAGMGVRRADEIAEDHARQFQVVDIIAPPLREANVLDAFAFAAETFEFFGASGALGFNSLDGHCAASINGVSCSFAAAYWIALTMFI